ncbi:DNA mismatch repair protein MutT [Solitalea longa]|uniref:GDP-mannose pyrophosphatase n=1 Tax=Solitalea longa TaxID=2079460 RepID=A0A2S5A0R4_9SPHI|nr:NUDIX hydrolase [Solitalea longa]POY35857.1 DNA mismatch repair protein MutT [Solitalea longa]
MSTDLHWQKLSSEYLVKDQWATLRADSCRMPNGKIIEPYYVLEYADWVNAVALTENNEVIMIRQYRHGAEQTMLEIVGGVIDDTDSSPEETVRRELLEETGYEFTSIEATVTLYPNPSTSSNKVYSFLAKGGKKVQGQVLDHSEEILVELISLEELKRLVLENKIPQAMHSSAIFYALIKLGQL